MEAVRVLLPVAEAMREDSWELKARVVEDDISLVEDFLGRGIPYREASLADMAKVQQRDESGTVTYHGKLP